MQILCKEINILFCQLHMTSPPCCMCSLIVYVNFPVVNCNGRDIVKTRGFLFLLTQRKLMTVKSVLKQKKFLAQHQTQVLRRCISPKSFPYDTNTTTHPFKSEN